MEVTEAPRNSETLYGETYRVSAETYGGSQPPYFDSCEEKELEKP